jgi:hypothetical protein
MARDLICPTCNGDLLLSGEEEAGEEIFCAACESPCVLKVDASGEPKPVSSY